MTISARRRLPGWRFPAVEVRILDMPAYLFIKTKIHLRELRAGAGEVHVVLAEELPTPGS